MCFPNDAESLIKFRKQDIRISQLTQFMGIIKQALLPSAIKARQGETQSCKVIMTNNFLFTCKYRVNTLFFEGEFEALKCENSSQILLFNMSSQNISEFIQSQKYLLLRHEELQEFFEVFPNVCSTSPFGLSESVLTAGPFFFFLTHNIIKTKFSRRIDVLFVGGLLVFKKVIGNVHSCS